MEDRKTFLAREVARELEGDIMPFWLRLSDPDGGFYGEVSSDGAVRCDAPRGAILNSRIIWSFAAAFAACGRKEYLEAALHAREWFARHIIDSEYGGVYRSVTSGGAPLDTKKQLYAQGFAIYALSELFKVTHDKADLDAAAGIFRIVEDKFADRRHGGYVEALSRDFSPIEDMSLSAHDINAAKTMNSHLHIMEAYANLYLVWPDPGLGAALESLIGITCDRMTGPDGHLRLYFDSDWSILPGAVSYGHDIETSWLLLECARALGRDDVVERVMPFSKALGRAGNEGLLPDGSMMYELLPDGTGDLSRQWWVQAEAVVGNLWLWKYHGDPEAFQRALRCWSWIGNNLLDPSGEWYWGINADGTKDLESPKAGFWKCPYHNSRMCLEVLKLFGR